MAHALGVISVAFGVSSVVLAVFFLIRNNIVYNARMRAIDTLSQFGREMLSRHESSQPVWEWYSNQPSYNEMMFDWRSWTFKQFFPNIHEAKRQGVQPQQ